MTLWFLAAVLLAAFAGLPMARWARHVCGKHSLLRAGVVVGSIAACTASFGWFARTPAELLLTSIFTVSAGTLICCDLAVLRLPDPIVGATYLALLPILVGVALIDGNWPSLWRTLSCAAIISIAYFVMGWINPTGISLGDIKYAGIIGAMMGWHSYQAATYGTIASFLIFGIIGLVLVKASKKSTKTQYPFGPFMVLGAFVGILLTSIL